MRHQCAGDVSDVLKIAFLRALAGADRTLGIAWYYEPGDDGHADGRHLEWRNEQAWQQLDTQLHAGLSMLPERSIAALGARRSGRRSACSIASRCRRASFVTHGNAKARHWMARTASFLTPTTGLARRRRSTPLSEIRLLGGLGERLCSSPFRGRACLTTRSCNRYINNRASGRCRSRRHAENQTSRCRAPRDRVPR
jgi:hypothetical protein